MSKEAAFGSDAWADWVFQSPPARDPRGRSRATQRFAPRFDGKTVWVEGTEQGAAYALDYFQRIGLVLRWKAQPFEWLPQSAPKPRIPDFLVEIRSRQRLIIQSKSKKYLTPLVAAEFEAERATALAAQVLHTVWTEDRPFTRPARTLFFRLRGARNTGYEPHALRALTDHVRACQRCTAGELSTAGHEPALILVAVRQGLVHIRLTEDLHERSIVSTTPITDGLGFLLGSGFDAQSWWNSLSNRQLDRAGA
ncbi:hypothetical protein [Pelomonas sp. KK5]|uniref:hypothetical protein n=1 Tax=Pelomonas sp. KK5 TaxID=1855730 RepID=UPI00118152C6|nr:hypothetical protein [Pelomonas sp. KK5]